MECELIRRTQRQAADCQVSGLEWVSVEKVAGIGAAARGVGGEWVRSGLSVPRFRSELT